MFTPVSNELVPVCTFIKFTFNSPIPVIILFNPLDFCAKACVPAYNSAVFCFIVFSEASNPCVPFCNFWLDVVKAPSTFVIPASNCCNFVGVFVCNNFSA